MEKPRLRDKHPLAFRPPSPPLPSLWREMTDEEILALEIPGVDPIAPPTLHADQVDMAICEKLREIDNNMAAVHSVLAYRILPGLKEYARVMEPIREVSRFWISMFEAACAPKEQPDVHMESEDSPAETRDATETTPTAASSSHTGSRRHNLTASEEASFQAFSESDRPDGLMTSTPATHGGKKQASKIFSKQESSRASTSDETPQERLLRQMENLQLEVASADASDTSTSTAPLSPSSFSVSSLSSFRSKVDQSVPNAKGKGRVPVPDLRTKALHNVALGTIQKTYGPVFTERSSVASSNLSITSSIDSSMTDYKHKPSSIFNPTVPPLSNTQAPIIFTRRPQVFAPAPAPSTGTMAQQRLVQNLLKEAEKDKRAGVPAGSTLPARSPARFKHVYDASNAMSRDDDTFSTRAGATNVHIDGYGNEIFGAMMEGSDDSFSDSDEEDGDGQIGDHIAHIPIMPEQYVMQDEDSSAGWHATGSLDNRDATTNFFGGGGIAPTGGNFRLRDAYRGAEPPSFTAETPIPSRLAEPRQ